MYTSPAGRRSPSVACQTPEPLPRNNVASDDANFGSSEEGGIRTVLRKSLTMLRHQSLDLHALLA